MKLLHFPSPRPLDFAKALKQIAAGIEAGEYGTVLTLYCLIETSDALAITAAGEIGDPVRNVGLLELAKHVVLNGEGDE